VIEVKQTAVQEKEGVGGREGERTAVVKALNLCANTSRKLPGPTKIKGRATSTVGRNKPGLTHTGMHKES
jgi:hypothetical protein